MIPEFNWMEFFISGLVGAIISLPVGVILEDPIRNFFGYLVCRANKQNVDIDGKWVAVFTMNINGVEQSYEELILLSTKFGRTRGIILPSARNYNAVRSVHRSKPLRVVGQLSDSFYFTGVWYHPVEQSRHRGAFQLIVSTTGSKMDGQWLGYSRRMSDIESGSWRWKRDK